MHELIDTGFAGNQKHLGGNMIKLLTLSALVLASSVSYSQSDIPLEHQISSIETVELPVEKNHFPKMKNMDPGIGEIIAATKEIIALGEKIYTLVQKGKPNITTEYAPINVLPRNPSTQKYVDPFEIAGTKDPVTKKYSTKIKNGLGAVVAQFDYTVFFSYGGSWNGKGKYIQNAMIVPTYAMASYMWNLSVKMKLEGITNKGTSQDPIATATMTIQYKVESTFNKIEKNDTIYVTGLGEYKVQQ
jgi:hypothetical protein